MRGGGRSCWLNHFTLRRDGGVVGLMATSGWNQLIFSLIGRGGGKGTLGGRGWIVLFFKRGRVRAAGL